MSKPSVWLVADASAVINLIATQCPAEILRALPERLVVTEIVADEVQEGRRRGRRDADVLDELRNRELLIIERLDAASEDLFERLVVGSASTTLDDGEAATIAYAAANSFGVIMDDGKARRICSERHADIEMRYSVEVFRHPALHQSLGPEGLESALLNALQMARMRVPAEHIDWVIGIIGGVNASGCPSLPRRTREIAATRQKSSANG